MPLEAALDAQSAQDRPKVTTRQGMLLAGLASGESIAEAGRVAGYASRHNAHDVYRNLRDRLLVDFDGVGITTRTIALKIKEKLDAKETKLFAKDGKITDAIDLEAHGIQLDAAKLAADLMGLTSDRNATNIGTVNVMFAGALPDWLQGQPQDQACRAVAVGASPELVQSGNSTDLVHTGNSGDNAPPPLSAVEGTEAGPGGLGHTHPTNLASSNCVVTDETVPVTGALAEGNFPGASVPVESVPAKAGTKLSQRIVKKRQARLPVFRGTK